MAFEVCVYQQISSHTTIVRRSFKVLPTWARKTSYIEFSVKEMGEGCQRLIYTVL